MKPSTRYAEDARLMTAFRSAFVDLVNHSRQHQELYRPELVRDTDHATWQAKRRATAMAAGAAAEAYSSHGGIHTVTQFGRSSTFDPVLNWETALKDPEHLSPESVISSVEAAVARALQLSREASLRERGFTGLVAAFLRWPVTLREAVGPGAAQRTAAGVVGVVGQVVVGLIVTAIVAAIVQAWTLITG